MSKQKIIPLAVLALTALGGVAGISRLSTTVVHAQSPAAQVQSVAEEANKPANEQEPEKNLLGGGHQDINETVDHQFEGVE